MGGVVVVVGELCFGFGLVPWIWALVVCVCSRVGWDMTFLDGVSGLGLARSELAKERVVEDGVEMVWRCARQSEGLATQSTHQSLSLVNAPIDRSATADGILLKRIRKEAMVRSGLIDRRSIRRLSQ